MILLAVFIVSLIIGQAISIGLGLVVERYSSPYTGLVTFIGCYFAMFWAAWRFAVRITEPRALLGSSTGAAEQ
jgi:hypothetical protein